MLSRARRQSSRAPCVVCVSLSSVARTVLFLFLGRQRCSLTNENRQGYCPDGTACRLKHELPDPRKRTRDVSNGGDQGVSTHFRRLFVFSIPNPGGVRAFFPCLSARGVCRVFVLSVSAFKTVFLKHVSGIRSAYERLAPGGTTAVVYAPTLAFLLVCHLVSGSPFGGQPRTFGSCCVLVCCCLLRMYLCRLCIYFRCRSALRSPCLFALSPPPPRPPRSLFFFAAGCALS